MQLDLERKPAKIAGANRAEPKVTFVEPEIVKRGTLPQITWGQLFFSDYSDSHD